MSLSKFVPLKQVVALFSDQYDKSEGDQDRYWLLGMRGLVVLNQDVSALPKTVRLPVQMNKTVPYPTDCLTWIKVGLMNERGEVNTLKINKALTTYRDTNPNRLNALANPDITSGINALAGLNTFVNGFDNGNYVNYYGIRGGLVQYGECRMDDKNRVVILPPDFPYSSILFEHISLPEMDPDFTVDIVFQEAIIAFIAWKLKLGTDREFYAEVKKARRSLPGKKVTLQELNQFVREVTGGYLHA